MGLSPGKMIRAGQWTPSSITGGLSWSAPGLSPCLVLFSRRTKQKTELGTKNHSQPTTPSPVIPFPPFQQAPSQCLQPPWSLLE